MKVRTAALIYLALTLVVTWPAALHFAHGTYDFGDPLHFAWTLAWIAHAIVADPRHLFDANVLFPEPLTLAYSETIVMPGVVLAPLTWIGVNAILVQNLLLVIGYVVSGVAAFMLVRRLTRDDAAALVAGAVLAVYPYRIEQYAHVQMQLVFWTPFILLALHRFVELPSRGRAAVLGAVTAAQCYTNIGYAIYSVVTILIVATCLVAVETGRKRWVLIRMGAVAGLIAAILAAPIGAVYAKASKIVGDRVLPEVEVYSAQPGDYLIAHPDNAMWGDDRQQGMAERRLFPGYVSPALALTAFIPPFGVATIGYAAAGVAAADLSLGPHGPGYVWFYEHLKPFRGVRVPARFGMLVGLSIAVLAGLGMSRVLGGRPPAVRWTAAVVAIGLVTAESRMRAIDFVELPDRAPAVYQWLKKQAPSVICEYPFANLEGRAGPQDETYMYYSTLHWQRMLNGDTGFMPKSYYETLNALRTFPDEASIAFLHARHVDLLLVHQAFYIKGNFTNDIRTLRARPDLEWVGEFRWRSGDLSEAFRLRPVRPQPAPAEGPRRQ
jgi:hypothetical protein